MDTSKILSVTSVLGFDTIFRDTDLSKKLGLQQGDPVPDAIQEDEEVLFWVESAIISTPHMRPEEVREFRIGLEMSPEEFDAYLGLPKGTTVRWEQNGTSSGATH